MKKNLVAIFFVLIAKVFYASVECAERGLDPLKTMLVVMSNAENAGGLVLSASPMAKSFRCFKCYA